MNIGNVPGQDRTAFTYRELYLKFRDSLSIDGSDLKDRLSESSGRWFPSVCARCCSAAEACLAEKSKSGAANIHSAFWDSKGNWGNGCGSVLEAFLGQLRIEDDETLRTLLRFNTGGDKSFSLMAGFFSHQAQSMFEYGAPRNCITVLKALLAEWWRSFSESFTASDKAGCMNWFDDNVGKIRLTAKLSEKAEEDKFLPEDRRLAPPAVGKGVMDNCILRIRDDLNQKNDDFWGSISLSRQAQHIIRASTTRAARRVDRALQTPHLRAGLLRCRTFGTWDEFTATPHIRAGLLKFDLFEAVI